MNLRTTIRRLRLYYKSGNAFRRNMVDPSLAWTLPFKSGNTVIAFRSGRNIRLSDRHWDLLPVACKLDEIGAETEILDDCKRVKLGELVLYSPLSTRSEPLYYKEIFIDDIYGTGGRNRDGETIVDIGAFVGDSAVAYARTGATVHAVEPSAALSACIRRNAESNGLASRIVVHAVGLSDHAETMQLRDERLQFVEGIQYVLDNLPENIDLLKMDCEGAEYYLLGDPRFLAHLRPKELRMEYHHGPESLATILRKDGFRVEYDKSALSLGLMAAFKDA